MISSRRLDEGFGLLDAIYEQGCNTFDTAHGYGDGESERALGQWVRQRGIREEVVIIDKGAHHNQDRRRVTPFDITSDLHDSLARLGFDYIDLYMLHRDDPAVPVGPIIEILHEHQKSGLIHGFGASNWSHQRINEANAYAAAHQLSPFAASSPQFSLAEQIEEPWENCVSISGPSGATGRDWYKKSDMPVFAWSSLAGGFFSGRFKRDNLEDFEGYYDRICIKSYCGEANFQRLERARQMAASRGMSLPQIALAYVISQPFDLYALVGCATGAEFAANLEAMTHRLSAEELDWLASGGQYPCQSIATPSRHQSER
jgi:aryl-alcohol dehydrogenase-like predicted oxidoreductase